MSLHRTGLDGAAFLGLDMLSYRSNINSLQTHTVVNPDHVIGSMIDDRQACRASKYRIRLLRHMM